RPLECIIRRLVIFRRFAIKTTSMRVAAHEYDLSHREVELKLALLRNVSNLSGDIGPAASIQVTATQQHAAFIHRPQPRKRTKERGFSRSVRPDHSEHRSRCDLNGNIFQDPASAALNTDFCGRQGTHSRLTSWYLRNRRKRKKGAPKAAVM